MSGAAGRRRPWPFPDLTPAVHGGVDRGELHSLGIDPGAIVDFSSNQSPLGTTPAARRAAAGAVLDAYPDRDAGRLAAALAARHGLAAECVVVGNGSTELIRLIAQIALLPDDVALSLAPSFGEYEAGTRLARARFEEEPLRPPSGSWSVVAGAAAPSAIAGTAASPATPGPAASPASTPGPSGSGPAPVEAPAFAYDHDGFAAVVERLHPRVCWICSPNNPTGAVVPADRLESLRRDFPETLFVLDEAYCDLLPYVQWLPSALESGPGNLLVLRSMTKAWGLAGLRLGYALAHGDVAGALRRAAPPWNVNACAQAAGLAVLAEDDHHAAAVEMLRRGRDELAAQIADLGFPVLASAAGFFLIEVGDPAAARSHLLEHGCLVRDCTSFGLPAYVRVSPRMAAQNRLLIEGFADLARVRRDVGDR